VDNRSGCAAMVEIMRRIQVLDIEPTVCMVGSVQEEVGIRAGGPIVNRFKPELMIALDVPLTGGTPGIEERTMLPGNGRRSRNQVLRLGPGAWRHRKQCP
jgi:endoglucanase